MSNGITSVGNEVRHEIDINHKDKEGNTALSLAYKNKRFDVIKFLVEEKGADTNIIIQSTKKSFIIHVIEENLFKFVPSLKFDVVLENGLSPLAIAVNSNNYDSVKLLIDKHKADVNFSDGYGRKAIHYAAAGGNTDIVNYLLNHSADVNSLDGNTALHYAAANRDGNRNIALLIQKGIDINCQNKNGIRPIRFAIENNHLTNLQILLNHGASLEMKDFEGIKSINPFIVVIALMRNHPITEALLKDQCVKVNDVLKFQYDYNPDKKANLGTILHWAVKNNKNEVIDILKPYIKSEHVNLESKYGNMPLHSAVAYNNITMVRSLLEVSNINVNVPNRWHARPIELAKSVEMILMLVNTGADIKSEQGKKSLVYPMLRFAKNKDNESLDTLLSHESLRRVIDINARASIDNYHDVSMLQIAALQGDIEMLKMLAKYKPNVNLKLINEDDKGKAILHYIAEKHSKTQDKAEKNKIKDTMTLLILLFNADLTLTDKRGKKPLDYLNDSKLKKYLEEDVIKLRDNINKICGTNPTDCMLHYFKDNSDISTALKSLNQLVKDVIEFANIISINIEKYINDLFNKAQVGFWEKKAPEEKRVRFDDGFSKEIFKYLSDVDKKNFFLSIVSDQANDYCQFASNFRLWCLTKDQNKSIEDHIKDLSDNFDQLMDEYARNTDNPSTSLNTPKVEKDNKGCTIM